MVNPKLRFSERIRAAYPRLTPGDRRVADHLLRTYPAGLLESASAIARTLDLHVSTVTRFFPKIGYDSIRAANQDVRDGLDFLTASPLARVREGGGAAKGDVAVFHEVERLDLNNVQETFKDLALADVRRFMQLLLDQKRAVFVFGARKHFTLCFYAFIQLNGVRPNVFLAATDNFSVADLLMRVRAGDLLWLFDFRRYPRMGAQAAEYVRQAGGQVALFTDSALAPTAGFADFKFVIATRGASAFDSYTAGTSLVNAFLAEYVRRAGETVQERYRAQEALFRHFEIFTWQDHPPRARAGNGSAALPARGGRRSGRRGTRP